MATSLWLTVTILTAGYIFWRLNNLGVGEVEAFGLALGGGLGLIQLSASTQALRKTERDPTERLQRYLIISFSMKFVMLLALAGFIAATRGNDGSFLANPEIAFMSYMGMVFLGFAWHGKLLEAPSDAGEAKPRR